MKYTGNEKEYKRLWYLRNKEKLNKKAKEYYQFHKESIKDRVNKYKKNNSNKVKEYYNRPIIQINRRNYQIDWGKRNIEKIRGYGKKQRAANMKSWEGFIPVRTICQICGKEIFFNRKNIKNSVHFDHKNGGNEIIKNKPQEWLRSFKRSPEREKIWESCKFGMLCGRCNVSLPTINRKQFITNVIKYMEMK